MKHIIIVCSLALLSACATTGSLTPEQKFEAYRAELKLQREKGELSPVAEQERLRDRYWQLYGRDAESAGHFAFSTTLMYKAEAGQFPMGEAEALIAAKESQLLAARKTDREQPWKWDGDVMKKFDDMDR
ncbi:MAG: hypothetical protein ABI648_08315 [Betaproteobacteria bacterium]